MSLLTTVPPNVVQSIRAFRVTELQEEAARLGQHFLYAYCADATTKQQVLAIIANAFHFPKHFGKNFDALRDCLTDLAHTRRDRSRVFWWCWSNCRIRRNSTRKRAKRCSTCSAMRPISGPTRKSRSACFIPFNRVACYILYC